MTNLNQYQNSEVVDVKRSQLHFADYNPRTKSPEVIKSLKRNFKKTGLLGGIVWNIKTCNIVSGHKRVEALDELMKYDGTVATDYTIRVEKIDISLKEEKEQNIYMNNKSHQAEYDYDMLAEIVPDIDYKAAGLSDEDLSFIGLDFLYKTDGQVDVEDAFDNINAPAAQERELENQIRKELRTAQVKEAKKAIQQKADEKFMNIDAYVTLSFSTAKAKAAFMERFGFGQDDKFIKGECFGDMIERVE